MGIEWAGVAGRLGQGQVNALALALLLLAPAGTGEGFQFPRGRVGLGGLGAVVEQITFLSV